MPGACPGDLVLCTDATAEAACLDGCAPLWACGNFVGYGSHHPTNWKNHFTSKTIVCRAHSQLRCGPTTIQPRAGAILYDNIHVTDSRWVGIANSCTWCSGTALRSCSLDASWPWSQTSLCSLGYSLLEQTQTFASLEPRLLYSSLLCSPTFTRCICQHKPWALMDTEFRGCLRGCITEETSGITCTFYYESDFQFDSKRGAGGATGR